MEKQDSQSKPFAKIERPLLDVNETAEMLRISGRYVRELLKRETLPAVHIGRRVLVRRSDVERFIANGGTDSKPQLTREQITVQIKHIEIEADSPDRFAMAAFRGTRPGKE